MGVKTEARSKWKCPDCTFTYESPVEGTIAVSHPHGNYQPARAMKSTWRSKYDKVAADERKQRVRGTVFYV
jgi:hypothetical protein